MKRKLYDYFHRATPKMILINFIGPTICLLNSLVISMRAMHIPLLLVSIIFMIIVFIVTILRIKLSIINKNGTDEEKTEDG